MDVDVNAVVRNLQMQIAEQALRIAVLEATLAGALVEPEQHAPVDVAPGE